MWSHPKRPASYRDEEIQQSCVRSSEQIKVPGACYGHEGISGKGQYSEQIHGLVQIGWVMLR